ncbi:MAG: DUF3427 domain-containing protein [Planctomycetota bacterium]|nr:DUF3427 domain-containing protein [Planctomycetota bacterium]
MQGLYEQIIDRLLASKLAALAGQPFTIERRPLDAADAYAYLAQHLHRLLEHGLRQIEGEDAVQRQVELCNEIIGVMLRQIGDGQADETVVAEEASRLLAVVETSPTGQPATIPRPDTPLSTSCLLTGTRLDPSLVSQLQKEILSADRIDILCSFIKWSGIRILEDQLRMFTGRPSTKLRIITTSYMGATDLKAIEFLQALPFAELKVSYDTHRTRLHAKAYLFHRDTGFGSAYIGSANLSHAALTEGLEWNVKVSQYEQSSLWDKIAATFETYWNDAEFCTYTPADRDRLRAALLAERSGGAQGAPALFFDLRPYSFQQEILDRIRAEREVQGRNRHLIVAATGTGKTMIAGFDYRSWRNRQLEDTGREPRLLFIAHREEILRQSLAAFRGILRDQNFGDLMVNSLRPASMDQVFCSIQTYNAQDMASALPADHYDYVVVDEFHHAAAPSYRRLLANIRPKVLLGLTATPERSDELDVLRYFDGHITAEIRLPDAINRKLLSPFQYFCVSDSVDLSSLQWQRGGYRLNDLDRIYTGNDMRAALVIQKVREKLLDVRRARGLGFCVSVAHAQYMAGKFQEAGIPAECLHGDSPDDVRRGVQNRLRRGEVNFIFVVDLYNEGVDIPEADVVLFLRPTESLTLFLQQLGRGLRLSEDKDCLTVLDFVGRAHQRFRFDLRFRSLLTDPTYRIDREIEQGLPHLPAGCNVHLERLTREYVLENIRHNLRMARPQIVNEIAGFESDTGLPLSLGAFLDHYELHPDDIYRRDSWSRLCAQAGVRPDFADPDEEQLAKGLRRIEHINDPHMIRRLMDLVQMPFQQLPIGLGDDEVRRMALMMHLSLWATRWIPRDLIESIARLQRNPTILAELRELMDYQLQQVRSVAPPLNLPFPCPLHLHSLYTRDEIMAALGRWTLQAQPDMREGVLHLPEVSTDALLITLNKTEDEYSPTTMYEDYAISADLFHWQSQSTTSDTSPTGQRYIQHSHRNHTILLFVREDKRANGLACPYHFLGPASYVSYTGSRPMSITWRLRYAMPAHLLRRTGRLASG